jgi:hypothetical protein
VSRASDLPFTSLGKELNAWNFIVPPVMPRPKKIAKKSLVRVRHGGTIMLGIFLGTVHNGFMEVAYEGMVPNLENDKDGWNQIFSESIAQKLISPEDYEKLEFEVGWC